MQLLVQPELYNQQNVSRVIQESAKIIIYCHLIYASHEKTLALGEIEVGIKIS